MLSAAREAAEQRQKNQEVLLLKLMRSVLFFKNQNSSNNSFPDLTDLTELLVTNGDTLLEKHLQENPAHF